MPEILKIVTCLISFWDLKITITLRTMNIQSNVSIDYIHCTSYTLYQCHRNVIKLGKNSILPSYVPFFLLKSSGCKILLILVIIYIESYSITHAL